jgi:6-phosphogluconolactonase (cycloisomerase 2 family)
MLAGCGTEQPVSACPANSNICGCGGISNVCMGDSIPLLYATTTSDQILVFSINSSGVLEALPVFAGPANSASVATAFNVLLFADQSSNSVYGDTVDQATGAVTALAGSPFSLGSPDVGPTSIMVGPYGYFYATEPGGTIVGYGTTSQVGVLGAPLPNSPYAAGTAPSQMAFAAQINSAPSAFFLYASDAGDPDGGILSYYLDPAGALSPIPGSPFPTLPNAQPTAVLYGAYYQSLGYPVGSFLFVSLTASGKVAVFSIDTTSGTLTPAPGSPFAVGNGPGALAEDNFNHLYVLNGIDHTISALNVGSNGMLTEIGSPVPAGTSNGGMTCCANNQLYVADTDSMSIDVFSIDPTGALALSGAPFPVPIPPLQLVYVGP